MQRFLKWLPTLFTQNSLLNTQGGNFCKATFPTATARRNEICDAIHQQRVKLAAELSKSLWSVHNSI